MPTDSIFVRINEKDGFVRECSSALRQVPDFISCACNVTIDVDVAGLEQCFKTYTLNLDYFSRHLTSASPDHFKRAAALLLAFCEHNVIPSYEITEEKEYTYQDGECASKYTSLMTNNCAEMVMFFVCYRWCFTYIRNIDHCKRPSVDYLDNIFVLIKKHIACGQNIVFSLDSMFMVFRSLCE